MTKDPSTLTRLLRDYGREKASGSRLTIVNQTINVPNFQFHPTMFYHLEKKPLIGKIHKDVNKYL